MTGYNRMNQRLAISHFSRSEGKEIKPLYFKCPVCGAEMSTEKRAERHCKEVH